HLISSMRLHGIMPLPSSREPACQSWCKLRAENHARIVSMPNRRPISAIANTQQGEIAAWRFPPYH
ncbi:MAG: hypothetical protein J6T88_00430, partial [Bacteroidales bacterium]|nr:hypothetical protein [Bacteroidales bacterium]